jgi:hypothetical protein
VRKSPKEKNPPTQTQLYSWKNANNFVLNVVLLFSVCQSRWSKTRKMPLLCKQLKTIYLAFACVLVVIFATNVISFSMCDGVNMQLNCHLLSRPPKCVHPARQCVQLVMLIARGQLCAIKVQSESDWLWRHKSRAVCAPRRSGWLSISLIFVLKCNSKFPLINQFNSWLRHNMQCVCKYEYLTYIYYFFIFFEFSRPLSLISNNPVQY